MKSRHHTCPAKQRARDLTVICPYRARTGYAVIPDRQQYVSLCGPLTKGGTSLAEGCEFHHVLSAGLARPSQLIGIERRKDIHEANLRAVEAAFEPSDRPTLYQGDIRYWIEQLHVAGKLRPAIVNLDTQAEPTNAVQLLNSILATLNESPHKQDHIMVVLNVIIENRQYNRRYTPDDLHKAMSHPACVNLLRDGGWYDSSSVYAYQSRFSSSRMCTTLLFRPGAGVHFRAPANVGESCRRSA